LSNRFTRAAAMAAAALALPAALAAQAPRPMAARPATPSANASAEARTWLNELQRISARLQAAHNRAMEDQRLRTAQEAFMRDVKASMQRVDPGLDVLATRVRTIQSEGAAAQQRGDRARLRTLNQELSQIQARFMTAQQNVMRQPAMAQRARQLEEQLHARMVQVEPETDRLIERGKDLQARLSRAQQAARQQQAPPAGPRRQ
jgi:chromosome segregation ATPase